MLKEMGVKIRFFNYLNLKYDKLSNVVGIDYKIGSDLIRNYGYINTTKNRTKLLISFFKKLKRNVDCLILFDNKASTNIQFELLPYIDYYYKRQLLKEKSLYTKILSGNRVYTDYYARTYNLDDDIEDDTEQGKIFYPKYKHKISLAWSINFCINRFYKKSSYTLYALSKIIHIKYHKPNLNRKFVLAANFSVKYPSLPFFQREQMLKILQEQFKTNNNVSIGFVPRKIYSENLKASKAVLSPFGWGETCYRDYETFMSGSALIKPDMNHLETWPNLYKKDVTYLPISWKIEDFSEELSNAMENEKLLFRIAKNGQEAFKKLWTKKGRKIFCERFIEMLKQS
ncbi:MAG: hypothetical protein ACFFAN_12635 [Promethearchaeota archaeon]